MIGPILMSADGHYAMPLATALRSLVEANRFHWPLEITVAVAEFPERLRHLVAASLPSGSAEIRWLEADLARFSGASRTTAVSGIHYARLLAAEIFSGMTCRALFLDADLLVLDDLGPLFAADLGEAPLGAVEDPMEPGLKANSPELEGIPRVRRYFNAGVLLFDLARWRAGGFAEKAIRYLEAHPHTRFSDQDALNVACDGRWAPLDPRWNHIDFSRRARFSDMPFPPGILHFAAGPKPWDYWRPTPSSRLYDAYRNRTRFARTQHDKLTDAARIAWFRLKRPLRVLVPRRRASGALRG